LFDINTIIISFLKYRKKENVYEDDF